MAALGNRTGVLAPGLKLLRPRPAVRTKMAPCLASMFLPGRVKEEGLTPLANSGEKRPPRVVTGPVSSRREAVEGRNNSISLV